MKKAKRTIPPKIDTLYKRVWRIVDGAVANCFDEHPDYLTPKGSKGKTARLSLNKRLVGAVTSFVSKETRDRTGNTGGRKGGSQ